MSDIVLSASVRQNLLSLQSTASLLATTQNDLATGNKVNSALDNPTNYFPAQNLNSRAGDIGNLLDSIGNGVQVLQAANTGITSLQSLISNAKSVANQVLQTAVGYDTLSTVTSAAVTGATASDILGTTDQTFTGISENNNNTTAAAISGSTTLSGASSSSSNALTTAFSAGDTITVDGQTLTFVTSGASGSNQINTTDTVSTLLSKIDALTGATGSSVSGGQLVIHTGTTADLSITSSDAAALAALGLGTGATQARGALAGQTLAIAATTSDGSTTATNITFGTGTGQISTLNALNTALAANDLQASISSTGVISITTTNNAASSTIGALSGTATGTGKSFTTTAGSAPVADATSQTTRASLVAQYNNILLQINSTAQDSSFNGVNLLNGDTLKLTFDETGKSSLSITGVTFNNAGLGLSTLTSGTDFLDNNSANKVLTTLNAASSTLSSEASTLGSNLSVVQIRQDFNKSLIDVLQTGASNLTLADTNQLAADSQALSTRQSIAVSALALANQSQQSVLQLLR